MKKRTPRWLIERQFGVAVTVFGFGVGFIVLGFEILDLPRCYAGLFIPLGLVLGGIGMSIMNRVEQLQQTGKSQLDSSEASRGEDKKGGRSHGKC